MTRRERSGPAVPLSRGGGDSLILRSTLQNGDSLSLPRPVSWNVFIGDWIMINKILFASFAAAAIAGTGSAGAADLSVPRARQAVIAPISSWTGCYVGGYAGGAWADRDGARFTDLGNARFNSFSGGVGAARIVPSHSSNEDLRGSFIGGGPRGCN